MSQALFGKFKELADEEKTAYLLSLNRKFRLKLLNQFSDQQIVDTIAYSDEDDAVACLTVLSCSRREAILQLLHVKKREKLRLLLSFAPQTAGRLTDSNFIEVKIDSPKSQIIKKVKEHYQQHNKPPTIIVEDSPPTGGGKILGRLPLELLIIDDWKIPKSVKLKPLPAVPHTLDQERLITKIAATSAKIIAVVDDKNRTLGIIRTHDLLRVLEQEATEDFYRFAGVPPEEHIFDSPLRSVKLRSRWLIINLFTAILAASVVSIFKETISQVVILAAFMPVVAGMGGNAGTQTLAVMVRGIATGDIKLKTAHWIVAKELAAGLLNGLIVGLVIGLVAFVWQGSALLGIVMFASIVINLLVAGFFGTIIPLGLKALRIDPALASTIFITTATDVIGFLAFLSLATWLLL